MSNCQGMYFKRHRNSKPRSFILLIWVLSFGYKKT